MGTRRAMIPAKISTWKSLAEKILVLENAMASQSSKYDNDYLYYNNHMHRFFGSLKLKQACPKHGGRSGNILQGMDMARILRSGAEF